jgi:ribosome biogenesis GTPase
LVLFPKKNRLLPPKGLPLIEDYGWTDALRQAFAPHAEAGHVPGRIVVHRREAHLVETDAGQVIARVSGRLRHEAREAGHPAAGDWVALAIKPGEASATIHAVLPRRTAFTRRAADSQQTLQVIASNIDVVFVVTSLNADFNPRRLERFLAAAWQSGARPVLLLTKADLSDAPEARAAEVAALATGCPVELVATKQGRGLDAVMRHIRPGETCVLIGSSGVGKSTLVNALLGEERMATQAIRASDARGRHTTSHRHLVRLPGGGLLLDTPGIREVGLVDAEEGVGQVFDDIEALAGQCRFRDCAHEGEPGCAIQAALEDGSLDPARWAAYQKLDAEMSAAALAKDRSAQAADRRRAAVQQRAYRSGKKNLRGS